MSNDHFNQGRQVGFTTIELVVAIAIVFILVSVAVVSFQDHMARKARAQAHAHTLASQALDCALAGRSPCPDAPSTVHASMRYTVTLQRTALSPELHGLQATVTWVPDGGTHTRPTPRFIRWETRLSGLPGWLGLSSP